MNKKNLQLLLDFFFSENFITTCDSYRNGVPATLTKPQIVIEGG